MAIQMHPHNDTLTVTQTCPHHDTYPQDDCLWDPFLNILTLTTDLNTIPLNSNSHSQWQWSLKHHYGHSVHDARPHHATRYHKVCPVQHLNSEISTYSLAAK